MCASAETSSLPGDLERTTICYRTRVQDGVGSRYAQGFILESKMSIDVRLGLFRQGVRLRFILRANHAADRRMSCADVQVP
jgi:hypothetical protein